MRLDERQFKSRTQIDLTNGYSNSRTWIAVSQTWKVNDVDLQVRGELKSTANERDAC